MNKITIENGELVIRIPLKTKRHNCYEAEGNPNYVGEEMDNIIGIIAGNEYGFAYQIDMSYAGKANQISDFFYKEMDLSKDDFEKLCTELKINSYEYQTCTECFKPIYGCSTWGNKGPVCYNCNLRYEK